MSTAKAVRACVEYDRAKRVIDRLTHEISEARCPRESPDDDFRNDPSCFTEAKERLEADARREWERKRGGPEEEFVEWPTLEKIEAVVSDCPACSRLCRLIRERKEARKRWGVAKRRVRAAARANGQATR